MKYLFCKITIECGFVQIKETNNLIQVYGV